MSFLFVSTKGAHPTGSPLNSATYKESSGGIEWPTLSHGNGANPFSVQVHEHVFLLTQSHHI